MYLLTYRFTIPGGPHPANYKCCSVHKDISKNIKLLPSNPWRKNAPKHQASSSSREPQKITHGDFPLLSQNTPKHSHITHKESPIPSVSNNTTDQLVSLSDRWSILWYHLLHHSPKNLSQTMAKNKSSATTVLLWNANGITNNTEELKLVLTEKNHRYSLHIRISSHLHL